MSTIVSSVLFVLAIALGLWVIFFYGREPMPTGAHEKSSFVTTYGPDEHGVVCYFYRSYGVSCVKVN